LLDNKEIEKEIVFTRTKHGADKVAKDLAKAGIKAEAIHGNKSQNARQSSLQNFTAKRTRVLVATDIAARGIDIDDMGHVINYELPNIPETYVHRIGRTGRAGSAGMAVSFCDNEEKEYLRDIQKLINKVIPVIKDHAFDQPVQQPIGRSNIAQPPANITFSNQRNDNYKKNRPAKNIFRSRAVGKPNQQTSSTI
jgi:ATP-dependent RNA helicase RhlE